MTLESFRIAGFRNLEDGVLEVPESGVAVVGANAQGKTNLLEAIYYLETFRSFRGARDDQLIRLGGDHFRLEARLGRGEEEDPITLSAAYLRSGRTKKVTLDGTEPERLSQAIGRVGAVLFTPEDVRIVSDGPGERRRFLDIVLSLNVPGYLEALQRYRQVLSNRNAALREGQGERAVAAWTPLLVETGARITSIRAGWLGESRNTFQGAHRAISGGEEVDMEYLPSISMEEVESVEEERVAECFRAALSQEMDRERRRGTTLTGPHRDEFRILLHPGTEEERDLRDYGSGGQRRSAALALRLLEAESVEARLGHPPILLLDDVFAELDEDRSLQVLQLLDRTARGQVILTAPKEADLRFRADLLPRWRIQCGVIREGGGPK